MKSDVFGEIQILYDTAYMKNLKKNDKKQTYLQDRNRLKKLDNVFMATRGARGRGRNRLGVWN